MRLAFRVIGCSGVLGKAMALLSAVDETLIRAAGVAGRVALERHLWTIVDSRKTTVQLNRRIMKKADTQDLMTA